MKIHAQIYKTVLTGFIYPVDAGKFPEYTGLTRGLVTRYPY